MTGIVHYTLYENSYLVKTVLVVDETGFYKEFKSKEGEFSIGDIVKVNGERLTKTDSKLARDIRHLYLTSKNRCLTKAFGSILTKQCGCEECARNHYEQENL